ncbi:MAG: asparagine--tRNA ligase [Nanoarchaeota archaeon]|nr:asparagine--tRNA ligase [Nanoarchaeota archaeon]
MIDSNAKSFFITGKFFEEQRLKLLLRDPIKNEITEMIVSNEDLKYHSMVDLPLETFIEMQDTSIKILAESNIAKRTGLGDFKKGTIRDYISDDDQVNRHLLLRDPLYFSIQKLRDNFFHSLNGFFNKKGLTWVAPSLLTKATEACEDITGLFWTNYENETTNMNEQVALAQTAQLHLEAMCASFGNLYSIAPSLRHELGEPTIKHLLEYWHIETELVGLTLTDLMDFTEEMIQFLVNQGIENCPTELQIIKASLGVSDDYITKLQEPYLRITYDRAIERLVKANHKQEGRLIQWGDDFDSNAEAIISTDKPVFVFDWPDKLKAFYFTRKEKRGVKYAKSFDLIGFHHGEVVGGGEREHRIDKFIELLDRQVESIKAHGHNPKDYRYYEDLRLIGSIPHGGFGMGFERALAFIYNLTDVRMASLFPRDQKRLYP